MKYSHILSGVAAFSFIAISGNAFAENADKGTHQGGIAKKIEKMDLDGNGQVTIEEASSNAGDHFKKMDADGDGLVTQEEMMSKYKAHRGGKLAKNPEMAEKMERVFDKKFSESDTDGDGAISESEFAARSERHLQKLDLNGDGVIEKEEAVSKIEEMRKKYKERHNVQEDSGAVGAE
jgi:Ca2+-binding EF-hand superfamily protein